MSRTLSLSAVAVAAALLPITSAAADSRTSDDRPDEAADVRVVATGLDNPRHLTVRSGAVYVAEAGVGGDGPCVAGPEGEACLGYTGAVTRLKGSEQRRVLTGLPSLAGADGTGAIGPSDIAFDGSRRYVLTLGLGLAPEARDTLGEPRLGTVERGSLRSWRTRTLADLAAYEQANDPDGAGPDSNPTGIARTRRGGYVVTDSGGNTLLQVSRSGRVSTLAVLPPVANPLPFGPPNAQAVPTSVVKGPDGAWYLSQLVGFPFAPGTSSIWRIERGGEPEVWATGLTGVTDLAWHDGELYAVQIADGGLLAGPPGSLVRVSPSGVEPVASLPFPYGVTFRHGDAYVSTCSLCGPGAGQVVRVDVD